MTLKASAYALGAGTIVNAIATWKGAAFGVDLKTTATVKLFDDEYSSNNQNSSQNDRQNKQNKRISGHIKGGGNPGLICRCVELTLDHFGLDYGGNVKTTSEVPSTRGLKSSSAASNATVLATVEALGEKMDIMDVIRIGVQASLDSGVTITGAFDDACASALGGVVITDNKEKELIDRFEMDSTVMIYAPKKKIQSSQTNVQRSRIMAPWVDMAYDLALKHDVEHAMTLNGLIYCSALGFSTDVTMRAMDIGVVGVGLSGTGPAYTAIVADDMVNDVKKAWSSLSGDIIQTKINNVGAKVL